MEIENSYDAQRDAELGDLVAEYLDRLNDGERVTAQQIFAEHPDLGRDVVEELRFFVQLETVHEETVPPLGTLGDYTLRRQIGRGGMGVVYEAWQNSVERTVALKVLPAGIAADNKAFVRFMREAKTAAQLSHANVVGVHGMGVEENTPYYAMEFVEGETLAQILSKLKGTEPETETPFGPKDQGDYFIRLARAFADVADGLQHAHSKGVIHRDIKPSNLILDGEGKLRILDFGLARLEGQESLTLSGDLMGTVLYMSPEQAMATRIPLDHRTDVYSLGTTVYEGLTGQPPFRGKDQHDTLSQIIARDPRPPRQLNSRVPADLETIVLKCLRKDPGDRYRTAEALAQDLKRFVRGDTIEAKPLSRLDRWARAMHRHRIALMAGGALMALALTGLLTAVVLVASAYQAAEDESQRRLSELYHSDTILAGHAWESGNLERCEKLLERHVPQPGGEDLRGWEWYHLKSLGERTVFSADVSPAEAKGVEWDSTGRFLAVTSSDDTIRVFDVSSSTSFRTIVAPGVQASDLHPRELSLVWVAEDGAVFIEDLVSGDRSDLLPSLPVYRHYQRDIQWSPDGARIAVYRGNDVVSILDNEGAVLRTLEVKRVPPFADDPVVALSWSPDGDWLASLQQSSRLDVWQMPAGRKLELGYLHLWRAYHVAWSPDGSSVLTTSADTTLAVRKPASPGRVTELSHSGHVYGGEWSPDGSLIASSGEDGIVRVWEVETKDVVREFRGHSGRVWSVAWSPGGRLASGGQDGRVHVWDPARSQSGVRIDAQGPAAWSKDGSTIVVAQRPKAWSKVGGNAVATDREGPGIRVLDSRTLESRINIRCEEKIVSLDVSTVSPRIAAAVVKEESPSSVRIFDMGTGDLVGSFEDPESLASVRWAPTAPLVATGSTKGTVRIREARSGEILHEWSGSLDGATVEWSPDGRHLAALDTRRRILIVTPDDEATVTLSVGSPERPQESLKPVRLAWSPCGHWLAQACINTRARGLIVFDVGDPTKPALAFRASAHNTSTQSVAWNPDGSRIATGSTGGRITIWSWDGSEAKELLTIDGHRWSVRWLAWDDTGERLLSADVDLDVRIWESRVNR